MAKLYICVGPPCSGKSTWAKKRAAESCIVRINRDELRTMFKGGYVHGDRVVEALCTEASLSIARSALTAGIDVILDNTNCFPGTVANVLFEVGKLQGEGTNVEVEFKVFDIPYWKQRWRNFKRAWFTSNVWTPATAAKQMHKDFLAVKAYIDDYHRGQPIG